VRRLAVGTAVLFVASLGLYLVGNTDGRRWLFLIVTLTVWCVFGLTARWFVRSGPVPVPVRPVLAVTVVTAVLQLPGLFFAPVSSTDLGRYVWDGRVQLSGTDPYRYTPFDDRLARLRDPVLFPGLRPDERTGWTSEPLPTTRPALLDQARNDPRTVLSRPLLPTPYPPLAQVYFTAVGAVTPWSWGVKGFQLAGALLAVAAGALLAAELRRRRHHPLHALAWSWCPLVVLEAGNGGHLDVVAAVLVLLACTAVARRACAPVVGLAVGAAIAVKLTPLVLLPAFTRWRREATSLWDAVRPGLVRGTVALGVLVLSYVPHVLVVGALAAGSVRGYLLEEDGENRTSLLSLVLPHAAAGPAAVAICLAVAGWAVFRKPRDDRHVAGDDDRDADRDDDVTRPALYLFAALLLTTTPVLAWYALTLVALAVLARRPEFVALAVAGHIAYGGHSYYPATPIGYALAALVIYLAATWRWQAARRAGQPVAS
jgi:hypothetical protein